jgi:hypothetical protein
MRRLFRGIVWSLAGIATALVLLLAVRLSRNLLHAHTNDAVPLRRLAVQATSPVREAAAAALVRLDTTSYTRGIEWSAVIVHRYTPPDTVVLVLYRTEDTSLIRRMFMPDPYVSGVARYVVADSRFAFFGVGIE